MLTVEVMARNGRWQRIMRRMGMPMVHDTRNVVVMPSLSRQRGQARSHFSLVDLIFQKRYCESAFTLDSFRNLLAGQKWGGRGQHPEKCRAELCREWLMSARSEASIISKAGRQIEKRKRRLSKALSTIVYICAFWEPPRARSGRTSEPPNRGFALEAPYRILVP